MKNRGAIVKKTAFRICLSLFLSGLSKYDSVFIWIMILRCSETNSVFHRHELRVDQPRQNIVLIVENNVWN